VDSDAEFVINDKDEMIKFSNKFLSFDNKINRMLSKTNNTTHFLSKRAQEHHKIKKKIDQLYKKIEEYCMI
jgi:peptidoglycan hydrolase CwlO-like protein